MSYNVGYPAQGMAEQVAGKYARNAGEWCRIHYTVTLCLLDDAPLTDLKNYLRLLRAR